MTIAASFFLFLVGLSVGSFINVLIDRIPRGESIIKGRSHCDFCQHPLAWYDLMPILSFIILRRRCRYCHNLLSWQYPMVEFITALLFVFTYASMIYIIEVKHFFLTLIYSLIIISGLIAIFFTDLKYRIIPDQILVVLTTFSLLFEFFFDRLLLFNHLGAGFSMLLIFLTLVLATQGKGMGLGDVKLAFYMGLLLGFPKIVISSYIAFLTGAVVSLILIVIGKKTMKSTIPFGPFLVTSTLVSLFYGEPLWRMFKGVLGI